MPCLEPTNKLANRDWVTNYCERNPRPILPDGTMFSLPIPSGDEEAFEDLQHCDADIGSVVAGITNGRMSGLNLVHLDPDLTSTRTATGKADPPGNSGEERLGQAGIAQSHLHRQGVGSGDIFLFFGLYRLVDETAQG